jgi:hypothetical protein
MNTRDDNKTRLVVGIIDQVLKESEDVAIKSDRVEQRLEGLKWELDRLKDLVPMDGPNQWFSEDSKEESDEVRASDIESIIGFRDVFMEKYGEPGRLELEAAWAKAPETLADKIAKARASHDQTVATTTPKSTPAKTVSFSSTDEVNTNPGMKTPSNQTTASAIQNLPPTKTTPSNLEIVTAAYNKLSKSNRNDQPDPADEIKPDEAPLPQSGSESNEEKRDRSNEGATKPDDKEKNVESSTKDKEK